MLNFRQRAILAKIESVENTDPTPTGLANAILCGNITVTPVEGEWAERNLAFATFGSMPDSLHNKRVKVQFDVEMAGAGAAGSAPAYGPLLRMCAYAETLTGGTKAMYTRISSAWESGTIYAYEGVILHKLTGARGTVSYFLSSGIPYMRFTLTGRWNAPSAASLPSCTFTQIDPLPVSRVNTPTFTIDGYAAVLQSFQLDANNTAIPRDRPNAAYVAVTNSMATGQASFEAPAIGTKDFVAMSITNPPTLVATQLIHGVTAGNIIQIDAPKTQVKEPNYGSDGDVRLLNVGLKFNRNAGDDDHSLTVK